MRNKYRNLTLVLITLFLMISSLIPSVLGRTRNAYLINFVLDSEIESFGFSNGIGEDKSVSFEATAFAIDIMDYYSKSPSNIEKLQGELKENINNMFDISNVDLYDLYYLTYSLKLLDYSFDISLVDKISLFLNGTQQINGGFSISNSSKSVSITSSFYVIELLGLIDQPVTNISSHKNWVLSSYNEDGGFGGNASLSSTLMSTYYAILILDEFNELNSLSDPNKTINYLKSYYFSNQEDVVNFGGYLPDKIATLALISSTYFCIKAISLIDEDELTITETTKWVLNRQNFQDGGFVDNTEAYQQKLSSVATSYYAFETLKLFDPSLSKLSQEIWMVEFNFWILGIVIISLGVIIAIAVLIWKKRRL